MSDRLGLKVLLIVAAIALTYLVIQSAIVRILPPALAGSSSLVPDHPDLALAAGETAATQTPSSALQRRMRRAALQAPLAPEPFLVLAAQAVSRGDIRHGVSLLEEARRRDPRDRGVRMLLLEQYIAMQDIEKATDELIMLPGLIPDSYEVIVAQLAALAANPQTAAATKRALASKPSMDAVLEFLAANGADADLVISLAQGRKRSGGEPPRWQALLIRNVVQAQQLGRGYEMWRSFYGIPQQSGANFVYDPDLRGLPGGQPFNWSLADGEIGVAEASRGGGLEVDYFGRTSGTLAEQLLMLSPGTYILSMQVEGAHREDTSTLTWNVSCASADKPLATLPLEQMSYTSRRFSKEFTVPASGCPGQWLRLQGVSDEFPAGRDAKVTRLSVTRVEDRR